MSDEIIFLGPTPAGESCAQVGDPDYMRDARAECLAYIDAIRRVVGREPENAQLKVIPQEHDAGVYLEVAIVFDGDNEWEADYAARCDAEAPTTWEEAGIQPPVRRASHR